MPSDLILSDDLSDPPSRRVAKAARIAREKNLLETYRYGLGAGARSTMDQYDTEAGHDAADTAMQAELRLLADGLSEAGGSAAGGQIVARWIGHFSNSNHRRYSRRFGA